MAHNKQMGTLVKYSGIYLDVHGYYTSSEPRTYDYPGSPAEFESNKILVEDTDIMPLLDYQQIEEIEQLAVESIEER